MTGSLAILLFFSAALSISSCLEWEDKNGDGKVMDVCQGVDVTFPWVFFTEPQETVISMGWFKEEGNGTQATNQVTLAFSSHGAFLPSPEYASRLHHHGTGSITLKNVTASDSGLYTIEVNGRDGVGSSFSVTRTVVLLVAAHIKSPDGHLHASLAPNAVHDDINGMWLLVLNCGIFSDIGNPPFYVEWVTPSGSVHNSTSYQNKQFTFLLPNPVETGTYTCRIPGQFAGQSCLPTDLSVIGQATVVVDGVKARLKLLEAEQQSTRQETSRLKQENEVLVGRLTAAEQNTQTLQSVVSNLTQTIDTMSNGVIQLTTEMGEMRADVQNLTNDVDALMHNQQLENQKLAALEQTVAHQNSQIVRLNASTDSLVKEIHMLETIHFNDQNSISQQFTDLKARLTALESGHAPLRQGSETQVSFHAQLTSNINVSSGKVLVLGKVYNNVGRAYDNTTGLFTAPKTGTYFFITTTGSHSVTQDAYVEIIAHNEQLCTAYAHRNSVSGEMATCHGVATLAAGEKVWLRSMLDSYFNYADTFFSGFLI